MSIKGERQDDEIMAEINMTPLIDVMLVLLILFMVTSSISLDSGFDVDLPKAVGKSTSSKESSAVIVTLLEDGRSAVRGKVVPFDNIKEEIATALAEEETDLVILEGDRSSNFGSAVSLMDLAREAGATRFAIAAQDK